ncbi:hypothetical protein D6850_12820 [Roseovarius spongiae]|uniref:Uncharacterized protein n=1 Tax=Roseovarius spongiae TaxID=2320272 RepID=A0A3A8ASS1_9RHOB|nr:YciI family protein [Roseovarius spongiae]RKF14232.1 hypothetical protein D6850_12820 [Roseovarius spongiae]
MANYLFIYHGGGMPETQEEGEKAMAQWMAWFGELGDAVVDGGNPVGKSSTVSANGVTGDGGANPTSGYTVVRAASQEAACELAKGCPMVVDGSGSVEVAEIIEM